MSETKEQLEASVEVNGLILRNSVLELENANLRAELELTKKNFEDYVEGGKNE